MTDEEWKSINEIYKKEFPDDMSFDKVSAKLDTMNNHPYIQELRSTFCTLIGLRRIKDSRGKKYMVLSA